MAVVVTSPVRLPGVGGSRDPRESARVRDLVRAEMVGSDVTIVVAELACTEPGCPPTETVIGFLHPGAPRQVKIHKPLREVTGDDVRHAMSAGDHTHG